MSGLAICMAIGLHASPTVRTQVEALNQEGLGLFERKQYAEGIVVFEKAYALQPLSGFLFNLALGHRLLGHCRESAEYYRKYLDAEPRLPNRKKVEGRLEEMERCAAGQATKVPGPAASEETPEAPEQPVKTALPATAPSAAVSAAAGGPPIPEARAEESARGPAPFVVAAFALAVGATSAGLLVSAKSDWSRLQMSCAPACMAQDTQGGRTKEQAGWILVGVASVALAAAIALWALGL